MNELQFPQVNLVENNELLNTLTTQLCHANSVIHPSYTSPNASVHIPYNLAAISFHS